MGKTAVETATLVLLTLMILGSLTLTALFAHRINVYPIKGRMPLLVIWSQIAIGLMLFKIYAFVETEVPCGVQTLLMAPGMTCFTAYTLRLGILLFRTEISANVVEINQHHAKPGENHGWYMKNVHLIRPVLLRRILLSAGIFYIVVAASLCVHFDYFNATTNCTLVTPPNLFAILLVAIHFLIALFLASRLRGERDTRGIRLEFIQLMVSFVVLFLLFAISKRHPTSADGSLFQVFFGFPTQIFSLLIPIIRSYKQPAANASDKEKFLLILRKPSSYQDFLKFLQREFAAENLLFYTAVDEYKQACADGGFSLELATKMFEEFIQPGGPLQVNVSHATVAAVTQKLDEFRKSPSSPQQLAIISTIFDDAQLEIFDLMKNDSFARYRLRVRKPQHQPASQTNLDHQPSSQTTLDDTKHIEMFVV